MQAHVRRWSMFGDPDSLIIEMARTAVRSAGGDVFGGQRRAYCDPSTGATCERAVFSLANPGTPLRPLAITVSIEEEKRFSAVSVYPFANEGVTHRLVLEAIKISDTGLEAELTGSSDLIPTLTFFDPLFHAQASAYEPGQSYPFSLAGIAHALEVFRPEPVVITDPAVIRRHKALWSAIDGEVAPAEDDHLVLQTKGMAFIGNIEGGEADEYQIQGTVTQVSSFSLGAHTVHAVRIRAFRRGGEDGDLVVYAPAPTIRGPLPVVGEDVRSLVWLHGHRVPDGGKPIGQNPLASEPPADARAGGFIARLRSALTRGHRRR